MQKTNVQTKKARRLCLFLGYIFSVGVPLAATLSCFPIWRARGGRAVLAGGTLLLIALCVLPFWRALKAHLKSPSVWMLWLFGLLFFALISCIAAEMQMICLFGFIGNLIGAICFSLARRRGGENGE